MKQRALLAVLGILCLPASGGPTPTPKPAAQVQEQPTLKLGYSVNLVVQGPGKVEIQPAPSDPAHPFFSPNTYVLLTARPNDNGQFDEWSGACAGQGVLCQFHLNRNVTASVVFKPKSAVVKRKITVVITGNVDSAHVTSEPAGINCRKSSGDCSGQFVSLSTLYLYSEGTVAYKVDWTSTGLLGEVNPEKHYVTLDRDQTVTVKFTKTRNLPDTVHVPDRIIMTGNKALEDSSE